MGSIIVVELEYTDHASWVSSHVKRERERERETKEEIRVPQKSLFWSY